MTIQRFTLCAAVAVALFWGAKPSDAAAIDPDSAAFRGGGCVGLIEHGQSQRSCENVGLVVEGLQIAINKDFSKTELEEGDDGEGMGGPPEGSGPGEEEETHEELFSRLAPIQTFFDVTNNLGVTIYSFDEWITNSTLDPWDGFLFRLRGAGAEDGLVAFVLGSPSPIADLFPDLSAGPMKLQWSGAQLAPGSAFHAQFQVSVSDSPTEGGYNFMLQEFPLVAAEAVDAEVPEPASVLLLLSGLAGIAILAKSRARPR
ncbi:MAG: PEP-CTERM sorting domain-containing protein [Acidobacteria bacterium]|nr:PEP-CTERM sorting domain-containing protein [Acidobacteriota bacterium]